MSQKQQPTPMNKTASSSEIDQESQQEVIELLKRTIQQLNNIVDKLTTEANPNPPSRAIIATLVANTEALGKSLEITEESLTSESHLTEEELKALSEAIETEDPTEPGATEQFFPKVNLPPQKKVVSSKNSSFLTAFIRDNWILTGIVITLVIVVWVGWVWLFPKLQVSELSLPNIPLFSSSNTPEIVETPPQLETPGLPEPVEVLPPPEPELTPEQGLIAAIQGEIVSLTRQYPEGLIVSIEPNFLAGRLIVTIGDEWYDLSQSRQGKLANTILEKAQRLDFRKLDLVNKQGNLIARSPVVGNEMIILESNTGDQNL